MTVRNFFALGASCAAIAGALILGVLWERKTTDHEPRAEKTPATQTAPPAQPPPPPSSPEGVVSISIKKDGFAPTGPGLVSHDPRHDHPLSGSRPEELEEEPAYRGIRRAYGTMKLGVVEETPFVFALDFPAPPGTHPDFYFDRNHDGSLADEAPVANQGTGIFAAVMDIPWNHIAPVDWPGTYKFWLWLKDPAKTNNEERLTHYSRTTLRGAVSIGGRSYPAAIYEFLANDAEFTTGAVAVDIDGDGKFDQSRESVVPGRTLDIGGRPYSFRIEW